MCVNVCVCGWDVCFNDCVPLCLFSSSEVFCRENRTVLKTGDTLKFPKLAETMETVAEQGANVFYTGSIGRDLIHDIKASGGWLGMCGEKIVRLRGNIEVREKERKRERERERERERSI